MRLLIVSRVKIEIIIKIDHAQCSNGEQYFYARTAHMIYQNQRNANKRGFVHIEWEISRRKCKAVEFSISLK